MTIEVRTEAFKWGVDVKATGWGKMEDFEFAYVSVKDVLDALYADLRKEVRSCDVKMMSGGWVERAGVAWRRRSERLSALQRKNGLRRASIREGEPMRRVDLLGEKFRFHGIESLEDGVWALRVEEGAY